MSIINTFSCRVHCDERRRSPSVKIAGSRAVHLDDVGGSLCACGVQVLLHDCVYMCYSFRSFNLQRQGPKTCVCGVLFSHLCDGGVQCCTRVVVEWSALYCLVIVYV